MSNKMSPYSNGDHRIAQAEQQPSHGSHRKKTTFSLIQILLGLTVASLILVNFFVVHTGNSPISAIESEMIGLKASLLNSRSRTRKPERVQIQQRNITFLMPSDRGDWVEAYSGMWWQDKTNFINEDWREWGGDMPIHASMKVLDDERSRQTRDWLDFCVEHLSILWKHFTYHSVDEDEIAYARIREILERYINETKALDIPRGSAAPTTIAVFPFFAKEDEADCSIKEKALGATLVSLWRIGIGRSVIVASSKDEERIVGRVFNSLQPKMKERRMQLAFHLATNLTEYEMELMPQVALVGLKMAMVGNFSKSLTQKWLGPDPSRWEFVYFSEPDLILHARQSAMASIRRELERGGGLSAHRFMAFPHQRSFPGYDQLDRVAPDVGPFSMIHELDGQSGDACCDAGKYYPTNPMDPTTPVGFFPCRRLMWWRCGFFLGKQNYTDIATVSKLHRHVPRPLVSLTGGTGFPLIHNNQKVCFPKKLGTCD